MRTIATMMCGICLTLLWIVSVKTAYAENPPRASSSADKRLVPGAAVDVEQLVITGTVAELRGDLQQALRETGLRETGQSGHYLPTRDFPTEDSGSGRVKVLTHFSTTSINLPGARGILGPPIRTVRVEDDELPRFTYLVRTGTKSFEARELISETKLGLVITLTVRSTDIPDQIEISPLKILVKTLDGREPTPGLNLDVGKPILSSRTLESSLTLKLKDKIAIALPSPSGRQLVLFLYAGRNQMQVDPEKMPGKAVLGSPTR